MADGRGGGIHDKGDRDFRGDRRGNDNGPVSYSVILSGDACVWIVTI